MKKLNLLVLVLLLALFSQAVYAQEFTSINQDMDQLESLITDTLRNAEEQQKLLEDLRESLSESETLINSYESIILEQERSLARFQARLNEMSEIYRTQSVLSARSERNSRFWRTFTLIAVPVATGLGIWLGISLVR